MSLLGRQSQVLVTDEVDFAGCHPRIEALRAYLEGKTGGRRLPARADIDPVDIPSLLPFINLIDVVRQDGADPRFRFRLIGSAQVEAVGFDQTGWFVDQALDPDRARIATTMMTRVVENKRPIYGRFPMGIAGREFILSERVQFPLSSDGEQVDMIISIHNFTALPQPQPQTRPESVQKA